jgi:rhodanese-related sulfurtransferase
MAAAAFREAGFDAYHVAGGLQEWMDQGLDLDPPDGEVAEPRAGS